MFGKSFHFRVGDDAGIAGLGRTVLTPRGFVLKLVPSIFTVLLAFCVLTVLASLVVGVVGPTLLLALLPRLNGFSVLDGEVDDGALLRAEYLGVVVQVPERRCKPTPSTTMVKN